MKEEGVGSGRKGGSCIYIETRDDPSYADSAVQCVNAVIPQARDWTSSFFRDEGGGLLINATVQSRKLERAIPNGIGWSYPANRCALAPWRAGRRTRRTSFSRGESRIVMSALAWQGSVQSSITTGPSLASTSAPRESEITSTGPVLAQETHNLQSIDVSETSR